ncbi:MAG: hypothetical protein FYV88_4560 [Bacteroidetes bacterium]|nr:hypothetical protein [Bacteroidota bacterium]
MIIGKSGSGKKVIKKCMVGLFTPEKGEIIFNGNKMIEMEKEESKMMRKKIGMMFKGKDLFD